ncbi:MazG family protein [Pseudonocardia cypriaca]|uniref:MazG family protein n=1 Tax=Pseudonocardia cypriaca TaxID=882449 RepID=UPI00114E0B7C
MVTTGVAQRTVVVLPERWSGILPAAAVPALRAAERVLADATVPDEVVTATGAVRADGWGDDGVAEVLLTTDPSRADGGAVVGLPEGAALLDAVAVMDRLRSPGGCPWDAEQTHESLLQYLVEECYELYQAIEDGDRDAIREELGDVLLQVLFHARVAAEHDARPFTIDDVAGDLVAKLVGRHPHVFAGSEQIDTAERQERRWEELKRAEKQRGSSVDGVPLGQPAVALAAKLTSRTARAHLPTDLLPAGASVGEQLFALAAKAKLAGVDPEAELRTAARRFADRVRAAEQAAVADGADPHALDAAGWRRYWPAAG